LVYLVGLVWLVWLVGFVCLVCLVYLVCLVDLVYLVDFVWLVYLVISSISSIWSGSSVSSITLVWSASFGTVNHILVETDRHLRHSVAGPKRCGLRLFMAQTVTLHLPEDTLQRYRRGATAARKVLEEFLVDRLMEAAPPLADDLPSPLHEELQSLENLDDEALWKVAQSQLLPGRQHLYSRLLAKNSQGTLTAREQERLAALGEEARRLTLKKAHAYMLLKWRGHHIPLRDELQRPE
jgi:hypothetical protein